MIKVLVLILIIAAAIFLIIITELKKTRICQPVTQAHGWQRAVRVHLYLNTFVSQYICIVIQMYGKMYAV